jgi:perosamine synthetase
MTTPLDRRTLFTSVAASGTAAFCPTTSPAGSRAADRPAGSWPVWDATEESALRDVLNSGRWSRTSGGPRLAAFEAAFAARQKAKYCIATSSGTTALLTTLGALGIGPGDEVILPPYTFVATFNVITASYALPVFVDTDPKTFQIDPAKIAAAVTPRTRAILPVHIGGSPADLGAIAPVAKAKNIPVIEDACQAPLAELRGTPVGAIGLGGCFSFQASKNLNAGEGGAVVTNDESFANLCHNFHTPGAPKPGPTAGRGSNFRLTEFQAGVLIAQMTRLDAQSKTREENAKYLTEMLERIPGITPAKLVDGCTRSAWHLYMMRYDRREFANLPRAKFLAALAKAGVAASGGYTNLTQTAHVKALAGNPHYQKIYGPTAMIRWLESSVCPVNNTLCDEAVWLTQTTLLRPRTEMERIATVIADIRKRAGDLARARVSVP